MTERGPLSTELFAELQALTDASLRGDLNGDQIAQLEHLLHDPAAMDVYLNLVWESDILSTWAKSSGQVQRVAVRTGRRVLMRHYVAAAVVVLAAIVPLVIWLTHTPSRPQIAQDAEVAHLPLVSISRPPASPVACLTRTVDCVWSADSAGLKPYDDLISGRKLVLVSGLAEIVFRDGTRTILEGPAALEVRSRTSAVLTRGKFAVTVEKPLAGGFAVDTPGMKYTDLGTEFGVLVAANGEQEVHVFRGKVQAEVARSKEHGAGSKEHRARSKMQGASGSSPDSLFPVPCPVLLSAHEAIHIASPGKPIERIVADETRFVRAILDPFPIFGTGVGLDRGASDPHWEITEISTDGNFKPRPAVVVVPEGIYVRDNRDRAQWISNSEPKNKLPAGCRWTLRTHFDLTGFEPSSACIEGQVSVDNFLVEMRVNGKAVPIPPGNRDENLLKSWLPLKIEEGFVSGENTLEIVIENGEGTPPDPATPMAICLELKGVARQCLKLKAEE